MINYTGDETPMLVHIKEKIKDIVTDDKRKPFISNRVQRIAIRLISSFFALILLFTIVSRVSGSAAVASVQVSTMTSGELTAQAEIDGTIDAEDGISIVLPEGLKVIAVNAEKGKKVNEGEALLEFNKEAIEREREKLEDEIYILNQRISLSGTGSSDSVLEAQQALEDAQEAYNRLTANSGRNDCADLEAALTSAKNNRDRVLTTTKQAFVKEAEDNLKSVKESAENDIRLAQQALSKAEYGTPAYDSALQNLENQKKYWENAITEAEEKLKAEKSRTDFSNEAAVMEAQAAIDDAKNALESAKRESEYSREDELYAAEKDIEAARRALKKAQEQASVSQTETEIEILTYKSELSDKEKIRDTLQDILDHDGHVTAPASGIVLKTLEKDSKTEEDVDAVTISRKGEGFVCKGSLEEESAENFSVGDTGELSYRLDGRTQKLNAQITSISAPDKNKKVLVTVALPDGTYTPGMSAQFSLSKKSETYQNCLPLTALRSSSDGDYILVLRKQSTVMGTEWIAARVDIIVRDRDSQMMNIESTEDALNYSDQVVTGSNKAISEGDRVRIED
ncbi:hypothetical protein CLOSCI_03050 [[Clostridium] scindens ATCC 35704]|nr:hypothetical protein [[Clostridium] scindens]EDS05682.1 hypothetical protein CLOSCI_03050 [[Clostridium] scindens ATCC 35704]BDF15040.1 hypothetical protein CE91St59_03030 [[Clostridium] scindens]